MWKGSLFKKNRSVFWIIISSYMYYHVSVIKKEYSLYIFCGSEMKICTVTIKWNLFVTLLCKWVCCCKILSMFCNVWFWRKKNKFQNYAFVDVKIMKMIWYYNKYKHTINHFMVSTMSVIERSRIRKRCLLMQNTTLLKRDLLCPWMS